MSSFSPVPVHVLTGFLGSGKTTLLNRLLKSAELADAAVIINEFGEVGLDHHLVEGSDDTIIELSNGCLCCTVRGQLVDTITLLLERSPARILIETTGLADPVPVLQALMASPAHQDQISLAGMFTVYDALHGASNLEAHKEARAQIRLADCVIISKLDTFPAVPRSEAFANSSLAVRGLNPACPIVSAQDFLADISGTLQSAASFRSNGVPGKQASPHTHSHDHTHDHHHGQESHSADISRHSDNIHALTLRADSPLEAVNLEMFLDLLLSAHGAHILRLKGLVNLRGKDRPLLVQAVQRTLSPHLFLDAWPGGKARTELVVFVQDLDPEFVQKLFRGFMNIPATDTPDRVALQENPLAIPGTGSFHSR